MAKLAAQAQAPKVPMYQLPEYRDVEDLKYKIASDPTLISNLATFADILGFAMCYGTRSQTVGQDFDVRQEGDKYIVQAHYNRNDPYAGNEPYVSSDVLQQLQHIAEDMVLMVGPLPRRLTEAETAAALSAHRLRIILSNFTITFDPDTFAFDYEHRGVKLLEPIEFDKADVMNGGNSNENITENFKYRLDQSIQHKTSITFKQGIKVGVKSTAKFNLFGGSGGTEISVEAMAEFAEGKETTKGDSHSQEFTVTYTGIVPAHSRRVIGLYVNRTSGNLSYSGLATVGFDVDFEGVLMQPVLSSQKRGLFSLHLGDDTHSGLEYIYEKWENRGIPGHWSLVTVDDWNRLIGNRPVLTDIMEFFHAGIGAPVSGTFSGVQGTSVFIEAEEPTSLSTERTTPGVSGKKATVSVLSAPAAATRQAPSVTIKLASATRDQRPVASGEFTGARVLGVESQAVKAE